MLEPDFAKLRMQMVKRQLAGRGVRDQKLLDAMGDVPRECFVSPSLVEFAYEDAPLPIAADQTISQPYMVASMIELARLAPHNRVMEIGAGSGYAAAVMSRMVRQVYAIERHEELATSARQRLKALDYDNVTVIHGDGTKGLPEQAPFDAIIVSAAGAEIPKALCQQLAEGGRLIIPVGAVPAQVLKRIIRRSGDKFDEESHGLVAFVPLIAEPGLVSPADEGNDGEGMVKLPAEGHSQ